MQATGNDSTPALASDMISSTAARLEWASQVRSAATRTPISGSSVERAEQLPHDVRVADRRRGGEEQAQSQKHQAEPDGDPADFPVGRGLGAEIDRDPDQDHDRRQPLHVEGQDLGDQRGPDVGAEHHRQSGGRLDQAAPANEATTRAGGGTALQDAGDADPGEERREAVAQRNPQHVPQLGAEDPLDAGADHARAPQQQRGRAEQLDQDVMRRGLVHWSQFAAAAERASGYPSLADVRGVRLTAPSRYWRDLNPQD